MREAGDVCYADVYRDGSGVVEFTTKDDMKLAIKHLDDSKFRSHEVHQSAILHIDLLRTALPTFQPISGRVDRASATETVDSGSILGWVKPKTIIAIKT